MKRIVLASTTVIERVDVTYGLRRIAEYLKAKLPDPCLLEIEIVSLPDAEDTERAAARLLERKPDLIGLSTFIWNLEVVLALSQRLKTQSPGTLVVLGGPQVSDPRCDVLAGNGSVDFAVRGEGEVTFSNVVLDWIGERAFPPASEAGLSYRTSAGHVVHNPDRPVIENLDEIPHAYGWFDAQPGVLYPLETTRGCHQRCAFCSLGARSFRYHSVEYVLQEIELMAAAGVKLAFLTDSSFTYNKQRAAAIAGRLKHHQIRYGCSARGEELGPEIISTLLDTGSFSVVVGLQSVSPEALRLMGRRFLRDQFAENMAQAVDRCRRDGNCTVGIDIIAGLPGDDLSNFCETLDYASKLRPHAIYAYPLQLLPSTRFFHHASEFGIRVASESEPDSRGPHAFFNLHRHGQVIETTSFPADEVEHARRLCLVNALIERTQTLQTVYRVLDVEHTKYSSFLMRLESLLGPAFCGGLAALGAGKTDSRAVLGEFCAALRAYGLQSGSAELHAIIEERLTVMLVRLGIKEFRRCAEDLPQRPFLAQANVTHTA